MLLSAVRLTHYDSTPLVADAPTPTRLVMHSLFILLALAVASPAAPDTLVVCPIEFRGALAPWETYRRGQGHEIAVVDVPASAAELRTTIRLYAAAGKLKYVVLIGDMPTGPAPVAGRRATTIPTNYMPATINTRWGSEPDIATDAPYGDVDGDQMPDLAIGRIPADSAEELAAVVGKVLRYEQGDDAADPAWRRRLHVVAGVGGFGALADALIEGAGRQVIQQTVPAAYDVRPTFANPASPHCPPPGEFTPCVCRQMNEGCLAWIYLGHGRPTELDRVATPRGARPILCVGDVPSLHCGTHSPLAVLVACYTGAVDAPTDCLAEELLLADRGPVAVIAATRVTMPYGNTVLGCELLRACFSDRPAAMGEVLRLAQRRTLDQPAAADTLRISLDSLAENVSPPPIDLAAERREHVWMYHLLGDPLVELRRSPDEVATAPANGTTSK
jgi:hypothetical protein